MAEILDLIDLEELRHQVREKYRDVAADPTGPQHRLDIHEVPATPNRRAAWQRRLPARRHLQRGYQPLPGQDRRLPADLPGAEAGWPDDGRGYLPGAPCTRRRSPRPRPLDWLNRW